MINSLILIGIGAIAFLIGIYTYQKNPFIEAAQAFLVVTFLLVLASFSGLLFYDSTTPNLAMFYLRFFFFSVILMYGGLLYMASLVQGKSGVGWFHKQRAYFVIIVLMTGVIGALAVAGKEVVGPDIRITSMAMIVVPLTIVACYMIAMLTILVSARKGLDDRRDKRQLDLIAVAITFPLLLMAGLSLSGTGLMHSPVAFSIGLLVTSLAFMYAVLRVKVFQLVTAKKPMLRLRGAADIDPSLGAGTPNFRVVMVEEKSPHIAYELMASEIAAGSPSLVVTRTHPDMVREKLTLGDTPTLWLATQPGAGRIEPNNLSILQHILTEFLRQNRQPSVLIDGLEYLITMNDFDRVLRFIFAIKDEAIMANAVLIFPLDPMVLHADQLAELEREMEVIKAEERGRDRDLNSGLGIHSPTG